MTESREIERLKRQIASTERELCLIGAAVAVLCLIIGLLANFT